MWRGLWPRVPVDEIPIRHVTNGVHLRSWAAPEMDDLLGRTLGPTWRRGPVDPAAWPAVRDIPDEEMWAVRNGQRARMVAQARHWLGVQAARRAPGTPVTGNPPPSERLDPDVLTLGFVGRFVAYKRPTLFLTDRDRLARLLGDPDRPVQIVFAGRAHPTDYAGKELLRAVVSFARESGLGRRLVFLEDFDIAMDQWLSQGVDVWLNTPRRPDEACGIAGMKSGINGTLNFSTLDGWWDEAWSAATTPGPVDRPPIGWVIGRAEPYDDHARQDLDDATSFYDTLERDIVPAFYERDAEGIPRRWLASVKESLATLGPLWTSDRMVREYVGEFYGPGVARQARLTPRGYSAARHLAAHLDRLRAEWRAVLVDGVTLGSTARGIAVQASVTLGTLGAGDVVVEVWVDDGNGHGHALDAALVPGAAGTDGVVPYARVVARDAIPTGSVVAVRVLPAHAALDDPWSTGLVAWSDGVEFPARRGA
jgi:starch phosphorylase